MWLPAMVSKQKNGQCNNRVIPTKAKPRGGIYAFYHCLADIRCEDPSTRLRSLRMTATFFVILLCVLIKADDHKSYL